MVEMVELEKVLVVDKTVAVVVPVDGLVMVEKEELP